MNSTTTRLIDLPSITPDRVLELKCEAKALKEREGIKQTAALAKIAQREGFPNWELLIAKAGGSDAVHDAKPLTDAQKRRRDRYHD
jgi:hypothetical protein